MNDMPRSISHLAAYVAHDHDHTPALDLIDQAVQQAHTTPGTLLIISLPPQEGKTTRVARLGTLWAITQNPHRRYGIVSYSHDAARSIADSVAADAACLPHDEPRLAPRVAGSHSGTYQVAGQSGISGLLVPIGVGAPSRGIYDTVIVDDPIPVREPPEAAAAYLDLVWEWWRTSLSTRIAPGASVICVQSRHPHDLASRLLADHGGHDWTVRTLTIPAQADHDPAKGETDPLGRQPGDWLLSVHRRTDRDWENLRHHVGPTTWNALYQGKP